MVCQRCGGRMRPLLTSTYCENDCDLEEVTPILGTRIDYDQHSDVIIVGEQSIPPSSWNATADDDGMDDWMQAVDEWWATMDGSD